jgi:hypothetical protein
MSSPHTDRDHSEFSPSALKYLASCNGYHGKDGTSPAAEKGTRIHEALEVRDPSGLKDNEEVTIYDQIVYEEDCFLRAARGDQEVHEDHMEIALDIKLNDGVVTWGTCDRLTILDNDTAVMADYKTGVSRIDPPEKNWQAWAYTIGAFQAFADLTEVIFVFYVPQREVTLHHTFKRRDMGALQAAITSVIKAASVTRPKWEQGTPEMNTLKPTVHCAYCRHEEKCPALGGLALSVASQVDDSLPDFKIGAVDDPAELEKMFSVSKILTKWAETIRKKAVEVAKDGAEYDNFALRSLGASRRIADNQKLIELAKLHGVTEEDLLKTATLSVTKVTKCMAKNGTLEKNVEEFLDDCEKQGIITRTPERWTLSEK